MGTLVVTEAELRNCLPIDNGSLGATEQSFSWISEGRVSMPPVMHIDIDKESAVDTKGAFVNGLEHLAVKIATGFFRNPQVGLPSCSSIIALMSAKTGTFDCIFLDNGYLMNLRTGLAGAVAAKHLAPQEIKTVGVVGTGVQARYQIESLALVRRFERLLVFGRNAASVSSYCSEMTNLLGIPVQPCQSLAELVTSAQVVVTTTPATEPIIMAEWLHTDLHITAMGSDLPGKQELHSNVLERADVVVCDVIDQCVIGGELQSLDEGSRKVLELGSIISGADQFSRPAGAVTICDLTGTGAQDTAIAVEAFYRVKATKLGASL
ncbi:ornithine cyclodeaminase family protein [Ruegeria arenilitoris]|uniref:ornithine cyclodeaminase family protein n=1 Tax=Ruegeria arenilitoris TaxID=1173585 RepID=UPI00147CF567|nr:ornithine cyclodeaminase family protein [Ruegeria arenilitoris]